MSQIQVSPFQQALDAVGLLSPEDQAMLVDVVQRRLVEWRRAEIARNAAATLQAVREGRARYGSVEDLKRDLAGTWEDEMSVNKAMVYQETLSRVMLLDVQQQLDLLAELTAMLRQAVVSPPRQSVMELQGLGKEIWQDIDAQEYVNQERDTWAG